MRLFEKDGFEFIENKSILYIRLTSNKIKEQIDYAYKNNISGFNITKSKGYNEIDLSFLEGVNTEKFKNLALIFHDDEINISSIHKLSFLEGLSINVSFNQEIDFNYFTNLKYCNIYWNKKIKNLNKSTKLKELYLSKYIGQDLSYFETLTSLISLAIDQSTIKSLKGIEQLNKLEYLALGYLKNVTNLDLLAQLPLLEKIKLYNLPKIEKLVNLSNLNFLNDLLIDSLKTLDSNSISVQEKVNIHFA